MNRRAFTLVETIMVISLIALLLGLLLPALGRVRESSKRTTCISNLRQLSVAFIAYCASNDERFPAGSYSHESGKLIKPHLHNPGAAIESWWDWPYYLDPYVGDARIHDCPTSPDPYPPPHNDADGNYGWNYNGLADSASLSRRSLKRVRNPAELIMVMDNGDAYLFQGSDTAAGVIEDFDLDWNPITLERTNRHAGDTANVGFVDGHIESHDLKWLLDYNRGAEKLPYGVQIN